MTWRFYFKSWAPVWAFSFALFVLSCRGFWPCFFGLLTGGGGLFAALTPKLYFFVEWFFSPQVWQVGNNSRFTFNLVVCVVIPANICIFDVIRVTVYLITDFVTRTIFGASTLVFHCAELTALISMMTWLFAVMNSRGRFFRLWFCEILLHSNLLKFTMEFATVQIYFFFKLWHDLFMGAVLQLNLVYGYLHVWKHLGMYEVFNDCSFFLCLFC